MTSQSCFYTISESISEVYGFALLKNDRLLIVGTAEVEVIVYELLWLTNLKTSDENDIEDNESAAKRKRNMLDESLIGSDMIEEDHDQGNVGFRYLAKYNLFLDDCSI